MKIILLAALGLTPLFVQSQMRFSPIDKIPYSYPESPEVNQCEYLFCLIACAQIENNMRSFNWRVSNQAIVEQCIYYLKNIGSSTALRLAHDIKDNAAYYANGSYLGPIFN